MHAQQHVWVCMFGQVVQKEWFTTLITETRKFARHDVCIEIITGTSGSYQQSHPLPANSRTSIVAIGMQGCSWSKAKQPKLANSHVDYGHPSYSATLQRCNSQTVCGCCQLMLADFRHISTQHIDFSCFPGILFYCPGVLLSRPWHEWLSQAGGGVVGILRSLRLLWIPQDRKNRKALTEVE